MILENRLLVPSRRSQARDVHSGWAHSPELHRLPFERVRIHDGMGRGRGAKRLAAHLTVAWARIAQFPIGLVPDGTAKARTVDCHYRPSCSNSSQPGRWSSNPASCPQPSSLSPWLRPPDCVRSAYRLPRLPLLTLKIDVINQ